MIHYLSRLYTTATNRHFQIENGTLQHHLWFHNVMILYIAKCKVIKIVRVQNVGSLNNVNTYTYVYIFVVVCLLNICETNTLQCGIRFHYFKNIDCGLLGYVTEE